ncbi:MAG: sigma 54-interacting transcriptional regulator [Deltaproteobacteria bacterium]|nr:sigma 54-interacting transcriptional regulator [Deltaproteobacteria bacterium]
MVELPDGAEIVFGRSRAVTIPVDHDKVSRQHARVTRRGGQIVVEDLGSRNGTRVNGEKIEGPQPVVAGDEIAVGPAVAVVGVASRLGRDARIASPDTLDDRLASEVDRALRYHRPLAVIMLRLEGEVGVIDAAVERVAGNVRRMDQIAEYGRDEYAVIVPEADRTGALEAARRITADAAAPGLIVHAGVAACPDDGGTPDALIAAARAALRVARTGAVEVAAPPVVPIPGDPVANAPAMRRLYELVARIADTPITVLVMGETGAGKELVTEALHLGSSRRAQPLIKLNCASLPETLLESELFGHERGSFTGAERRKLGYFEAATGGTLFLDELGEMPLGLQAKLLRVLERRAIIRVGGTSEIGVDVRVVAATHRDLEDEIKRGRFREDLYFRISGFTLVVPPLRDRHEDIGPLVDRFARGFAQELGQREPGVTPAAREALAAYAWPGNVRELRNAIERAVVLSAGATIDLSHLPDKVRDAARRQAPPSASSTDMREQLAEMERAAIEAALAAVGDNQTRAAERLGISRRALIYKMEKYGLKPPPQRG